MSFDPTVSAHSTGCTDPCSDSALPTDSCSPASKTSWTPELLLATDPRSIPGAVCEAWWPPQAFGAAIGPAATHQLVGA